MSRVVVVNKSVKDERLMDMFSQMVGSKEADPLVIMPKFNNVRKHAITIVKTLDKFAKNEKLRAMFTSDVEIDKGFNEINEYLVNLNKSLQYDIVKDEDVTEKNINTLYKTLKEDPNIRAISVMCARLRKDLAVITDLNIYYIGNQPDDNYQPFPFTSLNFSHLWTELPNADNGGNVIKQYVMLVLKKLMEKSYEIHNIIISPDIDIDEFSQTLIEAISKARGMLPRCKQAFDKIEESINLLKTNLNEYYKSYMISKNPNSILESFVIDVSQKQKGNTRLKWQFMQIVNFYRKHSSGKIAKDSDLHYVLENLDNQLDELGKATEGEKSTSETSTGDKDDFKGEVDDVNDMKLGFHHLDLIETTDTDGNSSSYILIIEETKYQEFLQYVSKKASISIKMLTRKIDAYDKFMSKEKAIESLGIYRTKLLKDIESFDCNGYVRKIIDITNKVN